MDIKIIVLNVKDGDAIIVHLCKEGKHFIILIDGGHHTDGEFIIEQLTPILNLTTKKAPDLVVCTHYDNDHIGGLKKIINNYRGDIQQILIHRTTQILEIPYKFKKSVRKSSSIFPSESDLVIGGDIDFCDLENDNGIGVILESIKQEAELIDLIDSIGIPCIEPIAGNYTIDGMEEFEIIGPTLEYYSKLFPKHFDVKEFLIQESAQLLSEVEPVVVSNNSPCEILDNLSKSKVTSPNLNSAIIKITIKGKIFLFTGDAGIDSFENIQNHKEVLKNIFWLKVPHHGSRNNINCDLIRLMSPETAAVSGNRYIDDSVINCLKSVGAKVSTTRDSNNHLTYTYFFEG